MRKYIKAVLIIIVLSSLIAGAYAYTAKDINPMLRDYLFFGSIPAWIISIITLGILVILDNMRNSKLRKAPHLNNNFTHSSLSLKIMLIIFNQPHNSPSLLETKYYYIH
jgi:hypothetical protein